MSMYGQAQYKYFLLLLLLAAAVVAVAVVAVVVVAVVVVVVAVVYLWIAFWIRISRSLILMFKNNVGIPRTKSGVGQMIASHAATADRASIYRLGYHDFPENEGPKSPPGFEERRTSKGGHRAWSFHRNHSSSVWGTIS